jgi:ABC-2 type transport system permease protein
MNKVWLVLRRELREIFQTRALLYSLCVLPLVILFMAGFVLNKASMAKGASSPGSAADLQSLITIGNLFRLYVLAEPLLIPTMIAAYSVVSEKNNRTLEPVLATPIETWQLLLAKCLSAIVPATLATWISGGIFTAEMAAFTPPAVFTQVITPGWLVLLILTVPMLTLTPVAVTVMTSSRFNDPRAASQVASLIFVALLLFFSLSGRSLVLSPLMSLGISAGLALLGAVLLWGATRVFQRENILTRWT